MYRDPDLRNEIYASVKEAHDTLIENDPLKWTLLSRQEEGQFEELLSSLSFRCVSRFRVKPSMHLLNTLQQECDHQAPGEAARDYQT